MGYTYRTIQGYSRTSSSQYCENSYATMPTGYRIAPFSRDVYNAVVRPYYWSTTAVCFLDQCRGSARNRDGTYTNSKWWSRTSNDRYKVNSCNYMLLIRRKCY
eukprot:TRINITY_DN284_c1_g1_i1.p1 TRINITY_DN284_c1_g1~~TRINITY_DN284_c1_g1_i1.p1  ORF type:complete len:103 (+),score=11.69 TRINITY_DN284_c1_g1_i1:259-567(+)